MEILTHPNPVLKQHAEEVDPTTDVGLLALVQQMARLMHEAPGVGLAAPQIGVQKRVIVYDVDEGVVAVCNPTFTRMSEETETEDEGCLSLPGISVPVARSAEVTCEGFDVDGNPIKVDATGLLARVLQHETDHLDGVLIVDRASPEDRKAALRRYNEILGEQ